jgi:HK97 family phage major capsid protein
MKKIAEINARLESIADELQALSDLSAESELDQTQIDLVNELDAEFSRLEGERDSLQAVQDKLDAAKAAKAVPQASSMVEPAQIEDSVKEDKQVIPARVKNQRVKHFASAEDAFTSGMYLASLGGDRKAKEFLAAQSIGVDADGGYTVPDPLSNALINLLESYGVARQACQRVVMSADTWTVPKVTAHASVFYPGEGSAISESDLSFGSVQLVAQKLAALVKMSSEITEDSVISMMDTVIESIAYSISIAEDENLFNGVTGGVLAPASAIKGNTSIDDTNVASPSALALTDLTACSVGIGNPVVGARNEWYINPTLFHGPIRDLLNAAGNNSMRELEEGQRPTLLGYPVNFVNVLPGASASTAGDLLAVFGDLRLGCYFGDRRALNFKTLNELYAENDQIGVVATERVSQVVANPSVISKITITP